MSQAISNLSVGDIVNITETVNGTSTNVPYLIISTGSSNPYGSNYVLCIRQYCSASTKYGNTSADVEYEGSVLDTYMQNFESRFDSDTLACIASSTIQCYNLIDDDTYTLARKCFALSNKELGGSYSTDPSVSLGYFTSNALRIAYSEGGTAQGWWSRSPASASAVCYVNYFGSIDSISPTNLYWARPALNLLSSSLVSSEANASDGSYNLLPDEGAERVMTFDCLVGTTTSTPSSVVIRMNQTAENFSLQVCNNYNDESPAWENATIGTVHTFVNNTKTDNSWAVGVKITASSENNMSFSEPVALVLC